MTVLHMRIAWWMTEARHTLRLDNTLLLFYSNNNGSRNALCLSDLVMLYVPYVCTVIPRLTKIIRSGITFVSRNLRGPKRDFPSVSTENRLIRSGCCPLFKDKFYKIVKSAL